MHGGTQATECFFLHCVGQRPKEQLPAETPGWVEIIESGKGLLYIIRTQLNRNPGIIVACHGFTRSLAGSDNDAAVLRPSPRPKSCQACVSPLPPGTRAPMWLPACAFLQLFDGGPLRAAQQGEANLLLAVLARVA
jgi:hypothetical protein